MSSPVRNKPFSGAVADKLWREALRKAALELTEGKDGATKLEEAARKLVDKAVADDMTAAKELGDRLDGKVAQSVEPSGDSGADIDETLAAMRERARRLRDAR